MEGIYYFGENLRWNLLWQNPNVAGAFVTTCLIALSAFSLTLILRKSWMCYLGISLLLVQTAGLFLLAKTYSRGALVAWIVTTVILLLLSLVRFGGRRIVWAHFVGLLFVMVLMLWATDFISRADPRFVSQDASATNRLVLWQGGAQMIAAAPLSGWGIDQSGSGFMNWYQDVEATAGYRGMVNSYLHVGVERGLPILALWLMLLFGVLFLSAYYGFNKGCPEWMAPFAMSTIGAWLALAICNFFSTLWIFKSLWFVPGAFALISLLLFLTALRKASFRIVVLGSLASITMALLVCLGLFAYGHSQNTTAYSLVKSDGFITLTNDNQGKGLSFLIYPDSDTLGQDVGKAIRQLLGEKKLGIQHIVIAWPEVKKQESTDDDLTMIVVCGASVNDSAIDYNGQDVLLLNPVGSVPVGLESANSVEILFGSVDIHRQQKRWLRSAKKNQWKITRIPGLGQDLTPMWPECLYMGKLSSEM
ncbi:O-antigen ligase family protein [Rubellicoccus peritrichatus]|uniref:O-antigen ligase family protein n=1 Tax=Rubellicoccus peritrichatus TaxID=3080537 RepID=A0AAQ3LDF1_9BACT|nr:O-antigen ligase family protein [Puniceicoccus sp. CR14]WOO42399.1 O-antigen ligase family protein [Puniceicoccus sp. CR14]